MKPVNQIIIRHGKCTSVFKNGGTLLSATAKLTTKIVVTSGNGCGWTPNISKRQFLERTTSRSNDHESKQGPQVEARTTSRSQDHKSKPGPGVLYGQWFRKLAEPVKAYCIACCLGDPWASAFLQPVYSPGTFGHSHA